MWCEGQRSGPLGSALSGTGVSSGGTENAVVYRDVYTSKDYLTVHLRFGRVLRVQDTAIKVRYMKKETACFLARCYSCKFENHTGNKIKHFF